MGLLSSVSEGILIPDTCECKPCVQAPLLTYTFKFTRKNNALLCAICYPYISNLGRMISLYYDKILFSGYNPLVKWYYINFKELPLDIYQYMKVLWELLQEFANVLSNTWTGQEEVGYIIEILEINLHKWRIYSC